MKAYKKSIEGEGLDFYLNGNDDRAMFLRSAKEKGLSVAQAQALAF